MIPGICNRLSPLECHWQLCWPQATAHSALAHSLGPCVQRAHEGGGHSWHSWKMLLARLAHATGTAGTRVCSVHAPCTHDFHTPSMVCTPRAQPDTHTCLGRPFLEHREARECPVPGVLMSHPTPDVTWVPCTWSLPKMWAHGHPLCTSCECHTRGSWWGEDSSTPASPRTGGPQHPAGSETALG